MRIGITSFFRGSAFSGSLPQVAVYLSRTLTELGHTVEFILPQDSDDWFIDCQEAAVCKRLKIETGVAINTYNLLIEIVWHLPPSIRSKIAEKTVLFNHYPAVFYDIENSVYPMASINRDFTAIDAIWTWSHFKKTDIKYLELLSKRPVFTIPFLWDPVFSDLYLKSAGLLDNLNESKESKESKQYEVVICESNESNTSNCTLPLTILSEIYKKTPVKWTVLNSNELVKRPFFINNILGNLSFDNKDISGNFCKRIRLPDLLRKPAIIISHQRWRPLKYMLLDALYLGIPLIHNSDELLGISGGEYYNLNRIGQALNAWDKILKSDTDLIKVRRELKTRFGFDAVKDGITSTIGLTVNYKDVVKAPLQLAFFDMWIDFQPECNLFVSALRARGIFVDINQETPNLIIFGPFGEENTKAKWASLPKIFFTGESLKPVLRDDIVLNIGFRRNLTFSYFRFPIWMCELNWFGENVELYKNPVPFSLDLLCPVNEDRKRKKFCAFVASNPRSVERNTLFNILSRYKKIDSAGRLFSNIDIIEGGPGGSRGQHKKLEFYKQYKFVLACENSRSNGYVTEKLLHAKLAGCVPIYWGDPVVNLDFNPGAFINVSNFKSAEELLLKVKELDEDHSAWQRIASCPLISNIDKCKEKLNLLADSIISCIDKKLLKVSEERSIQEKEKDVDALVDKKVSLPDVSTKPVDLLKVSDEKKVEKILKKGEYPVFKINNKEDKIIVTCCNHKYIPCVIKLILSSKCPVYVWGIDLNEDDKALIKRVGGIVNDFDTSWCGYQGWDDFWNLEYYAWKPLILWLSVQTFNKRTLILYLDAGVEITNNLDPIWSLIKKDNIFTVQMPEHKMRAWSHPTFCRLLKMSEDELQLPQYSANIVGFKTDSIYDDLFEKCLRLASNQEILAGKKWYRYSDECFGHRHDQSILSLLGHRKGVKPHLLNDFAGEKSNSSSTHLGLPFYVHRGLWKPIVPVAENIDEVFLINLQHRKDRLDKFWVSHPFLKELVYHVDAVYGNKLVLNKEIATLFRNNDFKWKKGVIGCALSHYYLWKHLSAHKFSNSCMILEDDVVLCPNFLLKWRNIAHLMPSDADIVFLGGVLPPNKPALPGFVDPVNSSFARVKKMRIGDTMRRYFHFCTYSYIITKAGAKKLCALIEEKGIFTSIDHMMVNHGDNLLNIYFTTPLMSGCFQDEDPAYKNADFNNFNRVDTFDSEIWNNVEHFSKEEISLVMNSVEKKSIQFIYFEHGQKICIEQDWLESIFGRSIKWIHFAENELLDRTVVIYYQHTTPVSQIEGWINRHSDLNMVLFHASDESCKADISLYRHPLIKTVFRNYWRPECAPDRKVVHLPLGYLKGKGGCSSLASGIRDRKYVWSFAGAMDRKGRREIIDKLRTDIPNHKLHMTPTWNSPENLGISEYAEILQSSKFVPCLAGFYNVESYRFYESLEQGAIPVIPLDDLNSYTNIFGGCLNPPTLALKNMNMLGQVLTMLNGNMDMLENIQKEMQNWWFGYKLYLKKLIASRMEEASK